MTLPEALAKAIKNKPMSAGDAAEAVLKAGYRTTARNFKAMVTAALTGPRFKRVAWGMYVARNA